MIRMTNLSLIKPKGLGLPAQPVCCTIISPQHSTMGANSQGQKGLYGILPSSSVIIEVLTLAKEISGIIPTKVVFGSANTLLMTIGVRFLIFPDDLFYVDK